MYLNQSDHNHYNSPLKSWVIDGLNALKNQLHLIRPGVFDKISGVSEGISRVSTKSSDLTSTIIKYVFGILAIGAALGYVSCRNTMRYGGRTGSLPLPKSDGVIYARPEWLDQVHQIQVEKNTEIAQFWDVIISSEDELIGSKPFSDARSKAITKALAQVNTNLQWTLTSDSKEPVLYVSGNGLSANIPAVYAIVEEAPMQLPFHVQAFLPPNSEPVFESISGEKVDMSHVRFEVIQNNDHCVLAVFLDPKLVQTNKLDSSQVKMLTGEIILAAIGEWAVMERIDAISLGPFDQTPKDALSISEVRKRVRDLPSNFTTNSDK